MALMNKPLVLASGIVLGIILTIVVSYTYLILNSNEVEHGCSFVIENEEKQGRLLEAVTDAGISHKIDQSGQFWYGCENETKVKEIAYRVMGRYDPKP